MSMIPQEFPQLYNTTNLENLTIDLGLETEPKIMGNGNFIQYGINGSAFNMNMVNKTQLDRFIRIDMPFRNLRSDKPYQSFFSNYFFDTLTMAYF